jgi:hypothetical protein
MRAFLIAGFLLVAATDSARANVCIDIDESRDMLSPHDRTAALRLVANQFEAAGEIIATDQCDVQYVLSHIQLGRTIIVTISGPHGPVEATALGLDDLPALYSQMVRSIVTGRPMTGFNVTDRTNVTAAQSTARRVHSDSFTYVRLGYGTLAGVSHQRGPVMGFGHRVELDSFGIDVSFLNYQIQQSEYGYGGYYGGGGMSGSFLKLEALRFMTPAANASTYVGGGVSWARTSFSTGAADSPMYWRGSGLQGELTVGREFPRASTVRLFVQADAGLPFYKTSGDQFVRFGTSSQQPARQRRYTPTISVSAGLGWQRHRP